MSLEACQDVLAELDSVLEDLKGVLHMVIERESLAEKKASEVASRPALKEARRKLSELRAEIKRLNDPASRALFEERYKDREEKLKNYVMAMKEQVFPNAGGTLSPPPQTYAERKAAQLLGAGAAEGYTSTEQVLDAAVNVQEDAVAALDRAERLQHVTEMTGRQTLEQLQLQTERLYQIDEELEDIRGQLDHAERDVKWFFRQLARDKCLLSLFGIFVIGFLVMLFIIIWKRR